MLSTYTDGYRGGSNRRRGASWILNQLPLSTVDAVVGYHWCVQQLIPGTSQSSLLETIGGGVGGGVVCFNPGVFRSFRSLFPCYLGTALPPNDALVCQRVLYVCTVTGFACIHIVRFDVMSV